LFALQLREIIVAFAFIFKPAQELSDSDQAAFAKRKTIASPPDDHRCGSVMPAVARRDLWRDNVPPAVVSVSQAGFRSSRVSEAQS
jgi:hypothetical protein